MFFWKKERKVQQNIQDYLHQAELCLSGLVEAMDIYFAEGVCERFETSIEHVHALERSADDRRRQIESDMYGKALIPESRGDILGMLEAMDLIPNQCESVLYQIWTQNLSVPGGYTEQFRQLLKANVESCSPLCNAMRDLFGKVERIRPGADLVTEKEAASDSIERELIKTIFNSDMDKADKILLKELVLEIGAISDRAENAADRLRNIAVKRQS